LSDSDAVLNRAPMLGEHNDYVLRKLLGLSRKEITELRKQEVIM
jgi:crotonobetainyl-CoA:carnitine CoA-transferase CaiB-like acyl-CoA transferase